MKQIPSNFVAHIGLDWADQKHDLCLKTANSDSFEYDIIQHKPEVIDEWAIGLRKRFNNKPVAICLELKAGPVVYALLKYDFIVLFLYRLRRLRSIERLSRKAALKMILQMLFFN